MKKKLLVTVFIIGSVSIIAFSICNHISEELALSSIRSKVEDKEKEIINILISNPDILDFLERELYSYDDEIDITYKKSEIKYFINGQVEEIDKNSKELLIAVFEKLNCERITFQEEPSGKALKLILEDVMINKDNIYTHTLLYAKNKNGDLENEILPNWYYEVLFYT